jgi:nicotinamide riboside kinase
MAALTVSLLGGESSGKSTLAHQLTKRLQGAGIQTVLVDEHLRSWCEAAGRAPHAHEQAELAREQTRRIEAATQSGAQVVIADTTAVMVAVYSEWYFQDTSLWPEALAAQRRLDLTLLMGLDLPWVPDGLFRDSPQVREVCDAILRRELQGAGIGFTPVYGQNEARLQAALRVVGARLGVPLASADPAWEQGTGRWSCENCSDPDCEHKLFTGLLRQRGLGSEPV